VFATARRKYGHLMVNVIFVFRIFIRTVNRSNVWSDIAYFSAIRSRSDVQCACLVSRRLDGVGRFGALVI
jgi:hypothetical protein